VILLCDDPEKPVRLSVHADAVVRLSLDGSIVSGNKPITTVPR